MERSVIILKNIQIQKKAGSESIVLHLPANLCKPFNEVF